MVENRQKRSSQEWHEWDSLSAGELLTYDATDIYSQYSVESSILKTRK